MNLFAWIRERFKRTARSSHTQAAMQESNELLVVKRQLVEFTNNLDAGRIGEDQKVLRLSHNVLERAYLGTRQENDRDIRDN